MRLKKIADDLNNEIYQDVLTDAPKKVKFNNLTDSTNVREMTTKRITLTNKIDK
eukprot:CAMPEP_0205812974 /NCGR_PEP_ID=MMETSP0205-20121125/17606_1 /ASSEMBLY_ACC=CAM_ASM_000278 /TAXON_ID=36767 /ORGANISM="Euplotes focardii, Strain TN1" /LENGTH=53 /DNA_ID=CAMNT_0053094545 /DNA_START=466 /DNA_END=627 /DNA_ORIENTATION=-